MYRETYVPTHSGLGPAALIRAVPQLRKQTIIADVARERKLTEGIVGYVNGLSRSREPGRQRWLARQVFIGRPPAPRRVRTRQS